MKHIWDSAFGLLLVTGALLGVTPPLGKLATAAGVPALTWSFVISFGAGGILLCVLLARRGSVGFAAPKLRYFFITAMISYAIPNIVMFSAIPHLGAGYTAIMFTLSPVITLGLSILLGVRRPDRLGIAGIAVGFVGAVLVATTRGEVGQPAELSWVFIGLLIPVSLAAGNIYRTMDWPDGSTPLELAAGSHLAAASMLLAGILVVGDAGAFMLLSEIPILVVAQVAAASIMFAFFFRLQAVGGPVYLSQIGYVGAAVGLAAGVLFLGENYAPLTWIGAVIVAIGVIMTTRLRAALRSRRKAWHERRNALHCHLIQRKSNNMRITVFGALGNVGSRVVAEALSRGHEVTGVTRNIGRFDELPVGVKPRAGDAGSVDDVAELSVGQDIVVSATRPVPGREHEFVSVARALLKGLEGTGVRLLLVGGAATLTVPGSGIAAVDDPSFVPSGARNIAVACADQLEVCRAEPAVDWTYLSPPALLMPGKRTGNYRVGTDELLLDTEGRSTISFEDLAVALMDEVERPKHHRIRFTVGY
jgi:putative NADH-flavin reductase/drug/metabolite transporter (DMT)-like permease